MKSLSHTITAAIIAVLLTILVGLMLKVPFLATKEAQTSDEMMKLRYLLQKKLAPMPTDRHLVFAAIDERSVRDLGEWPFPRSTHGQFMAVLAPEHPKAVGWDVLFIDTKSAPETAPPPAVTPAPTPAPTTTSASPDATNSVPLSAPVPASGTPDTSTPAPASPSTDAASAPPPPESDDQVLVDGASLLPHVVMASLHNDSGDSPSAEDMLPTRPFQNVIGDTSHLLSAPSARLPFPALRKKSYFGFADEDTEGVVRHTLPLVVDIGGKILPSLDLQILLQYWDVDPDQVTVNIGHEITVQLPDGTQQHIPIDQNGCVTINYRARQHDFQEMSYSQMGAGLADPASDERKHLPPLKDNIVVIGVTLTGTDAGVNPLDSNSPNVVTHLNLLNNILQHDFIRQLSPWAWMPLYAFFVFAMGNLMLRVGIPFMVATALFSMLLMAAAGFAALWFDNLQVPVALPELGLLLLAIAVPSKGFFGEEREKERIKGVLRANLSEKVMVKLLEHPENSNLGGVKQEITVMFCDIRGFTKYCDNRDSAEVMEVLNDYMETMTQVVFKYDGTVDKYIGDCIMAFWNAPYTQTDHAQRAVCCAMEMRYALANFKTKRAGIDVELFECGIGIHTGEALVGMMGSSIKRNYTAMGSTVNMGARLETLTKKLNERILVSQETVDQLTGEFPLTDRGEALVPGFTRAIHVYAVGADQDISSALKVGRTLATQQEYTAEEVTAPIWKPAPLPEDADPNP